MSRYKINTDTILYNQLGDEGVVFDMKNNEYFSLNETYFAILRAIENKKTEIEIVADLCETYEVSEEECQVEVRAVIEELLHKKFIIEA